MLSSLNSSSDIGHLLSSVVFHGLKSPDVGSRSSCSDAEFQDCRYLPQQSEIWCLFKKFFFDHKEVSGVQSLLFLELEADMKGHNVENSLGITAKDLRCLDKILTKIESKYLPGLFLKYERFRLFFQHRMMPSQNVKCKKRNYITALKSASSLCDLGDKEDSFIADIVKSKPAIDEFFRDRLIKDETGSYNTPGEILKKEYDDQGNVRNKCALSSSHDDFAAYETTGPLPRTKARGRSCMTGINSEVGNNSKTDKRLNAAVETERAKVVQKKRRMLNKSKSNHSELTSGEDTRERHIISGTDVEALSDSTDCASAKSKKHNSCSCPICGLELKNAKMLKSHVKSHTQRNKKNACSECGETFQQRSALTLHSKMCSLKNKSVLRESEGNSCTDQGLNSDSQTEDRRNNDLLLARHKSFSTDVGDDTLDSFPSQDTKDKTKDSNFFTCDICNKICNGQARLKQHLLTHAGEKSFPCQICDSAFSDKSHLNVHMRIHSGEKPFECDICHATFTESTKLKNHKRVHTGEKPYVCEICGSSFSISSSLRSHMKVHSEQRPFKCDVCDYASARASSLRAHRLVHTGEKNFVCDKCGASFMDKTKLKRHKMVHTGERPYSCEICGTRFADKSHLTVHLRIHAGDKPFKCDFCPMSFVESSKLKNHLRKHTGEKPFICEVCGASFAVSYSLKSHMRRHTGEKPYKCDICSYATSQSSNLKVHMVVHNGHRPHTCDDCGASFSKLSKLNDHKTVHICLEGEQTSNSVVNVGHEPTQSVFSTSSISTYSNTFSVDVQHQFTDIRNSILPTSHPTFGTINTLNTAHPSHNISPNSYPSGLTSQGGPTAASHVQQFPAGIPSHGASHVTSTYFNIPLGFGNERANIENGHHHGTSNSGTFEFTSLYKGDGGPDSALQMDFTSL